MVQLTRNQSLLCTQAVHSRVSLFPQDFGSGVFVLHATE